MAEERTQHHSPMIPPDAVKSVLQPTPVTVGAVQAKRKPTASELGPKEYCWGTGRRKSAIARVWLRPGSGKITVNDRELENYFPLPQDQNAVKAPLEATRLTAMYDIWVDVQGGGSTGQSGAAKLGVARALLQADPDSFVTLRDKGYLTRDSRMKERKKYGQLGARRRYQFSKR